MITKPDVGSGTYLRQWQKALATGRPWPIVQAVLAPLASLRLTVALFAMSLFLVWVGTVAQQDLSMWQVIRRYFHSFVAWVEFRHVFPAVFFSGVPWLYKALTPTGGFFFPGGITLGMALFVNLAAAHLSKFKLRAKGAQLVGGIVTMAVAIVWCVLMVQTGQGQGELQDKPPIGWDTLWLLLKLLATAISVGAVVGTWFLIRKCRASGRSLLSLDVGLATGVSIVLVSSTLALWVTRQFIGPESMRILYHLAQGITCGGALLAASYLLFGQRGGVVTLHLGIGLLMFGELLVSLYAVEEQVTMADGETRNYAIDIRSVELAVIDRSDPKEDAVTVIPMSYKETPTAWADGRRIVHPSFPFTIEVVKFYPSARLAERSGGSKNLATRGIGRRVIAVPDVQGAGAKMGSTVDFAAAYVRLRDAAHGKDLGTYLVAQQLSIQDRLEPVQVGDKTYWLSLRFRRTYKPYAITLVDVRKDDYIGTNTPRSYSSTVRLQAPKYQFDETLTISMNNPVRFAGETFYQSGYHRDEQTGTESTTLQIVTNIGWLIPYVACGIVMVGLAAHLSMVLLRFLERWNPDTLQPLGWGAVAIGVAIGVTAFGGIERRMMKGASDAPGGFASHRFGALPVVAKGRAKPYDTLARSSLRILAGRESVHWGERSEKVPAITWLLDVIAGKEKAKEYRVFRIDNREVMHLLKLRPRPGNRFAMSEIEPRLEAILDQARRAQQTDRSLQTPFQRKVLELWTKLDLVFDLQRAFETMPESIEGLSPYEVAEVVARSADRVGRTLDAGVPYAVPRTDRAHPWEPLASATARNWMRKVLKRLDVSDSQALAKKLIEGIRSDKERMKQLVEAKTLSMITEILSAQPGSKGQSQRELESLAREKLSAMPQKMRESVLRMSQERLGQDLQRLESTIAAAADRLLGTQSDPRADALAERFERLLTAYRGGQVVAFNAQVAKIEADFMKNGADELDMNRVRFESGFNHVSPFVSAIPVYIIVLILGVIGLVPSLRWLRWFTLGLLIVACLWHLGALAGRVYIAGRPPVTNLYSSAVFIAWGVVLLGIIVEFVYRIGVGNVASSFAAIFGLLVGRLLSTEVPTQAGDTFTVMQAVLDTQFWLSTHVLCISFGYVTTLLAGVVGVLAIGWGGVRWLTSSDPGVDEASMARVSNRLNGIIYFVVCLGIFFSFVGTVLGGLWADDSWGRFWGWDPKENGALMIVLWNAVILHARWARLVQGRGVAVLSVIGLMFLGWSWMGVNELGFGLHSYGQTEGVILALVVSWFVLLTVAVVGMVTPKDAFKLKA